jgi:hypothetical protein
VVAVRATAPDAQPAAQHLDQPQLHRLRALAYRLGARVDMRALHAAATAQRPAGL